MTTVGLSTLAPSEGYKINLQVPLKLTNYHVVFHLFDLLCLCSLS